MNPLRNALRLIALYVIAAATTAHALRGDRERCLEAGMDAYLCKPIDLDDLKAAVEKAFLM